MPEGSDVFLEKVGLIMESPTERNKYRDLSTITEKLDFLRSHFIMNELAVRLLERKYLLNTHDRDNLLREIDDLIKKQD
ncbi:MAG: hypothetical protein OEX22_11225 [Cyclobacteriaceae bacterium]|nr:hypothetical protein [Cyclobacteriaceae bacterium]